MKKPNKQSIDWKKEYQFVYWSLTPYIALLEQMVQGKEVDAETFEKAAAHYKAALVRWNFYSQK